MDCKELQEKFDVLRGLCQNVFTERNNIVQYHQALSRLEQFVKILDKELDVIDVPEKSDNQALTPEQHKQLMEHVTIIYHGIKDLTGFSEKGSLDEELKENIMYTAESEFDRICKIVDYDGDTVQKTERRYEEIRQANQRIRELEGLLGQDENSRDKVTFTLKQLEKVVEDWWRQDGLGHVFTDSKFNTWAYFAKLSCRSLDIDLKDGESIEGVYREFHLQKDPSSSGEYVLKANDHNRDKIIALIHHRFPNARLIRMTTRWGKDVPYIQDIEVAIPIDDI